MWGEARRGKGSSPYSLPTACCNGITVLLVRCPIPCSQLGLKAVAEFLLCGVQFFEMTTQYP